MRTSPANYSKLGNPYKPKTRATSLTNSPQLKTLHQEVTIPISYLAYTRNYSLFKKFHFCWSMQRNQSALYD